jgi:hypothetical protein
MAVHDYGVDLSQSRRALALVVAYLRSTGRSVEDVSNDVRYGSRGVHLLVDGATVLFHADTKMAETGNMVLEIVADLDRQVWGIDLTSQASHIYYYSVNDGKLYRIPRAALVEAFKASREPVFKFAKPHTKVGDEGATYTGLAVLLSPLWMSANNVPFEMERVKEPPAPRSRQLSMFGNGGRS